MPQAIGLRIYKLFFSEKGSSREISRDDLPFDDFDLVKRFVAKHSVRTKPDGNERSWYFDTPAKSDQFHVAGLVEYGTSGFTSKLLDIKTNKKKYDRVETDVEQIPLFFDFWQPPQADFLMVALQSFGTRSCVDLIQGALRLFADHDKPKYVARFRKVMPNDSNNALFGDKAVKKLTFVAAKASSDVAASLIPFKPSEPVNLAISVRSGRGRGLGTFAEVAGRVGKHEGVFQYEGVGFTEAYADIRVGGRVRKIGVFGPSGDTGTIDITGDVTFKNGHPTYDSLVVQANQILADFYGLMTE